MEVVSTVSKVHKEGQAKLDEFEEKVSAAILEIERETSDQELRTGLSRLFFSKAEKMQLKDGAMVVVLEVPVPFLKEFKEIQDAFSGSLEKKMPGASVVVFGARTILPKSYKYKRPIDRTQTAVHEAWINDMLYPIEAVGKRTRYHVDGSKTIKILVDKKHIKDFEPRSKILSEIYKQKTNKNLAFEFVSGEF